jgi:hypothetical protein
MAANFIHAHPYPAPSKETSMQKYSAVTIKKERSTAPHASDQEMPHADKELSSFPDTGYGTSNAVMKNGGGAERIRASHTGTTVGLAGSDILAERMNPDVEISDTADPSDIVEVTPENLVNRNSPDSTTLKKKRANHGVDGRAEPVTVIRRNARGKDTNGA